jgi:hypothetical protein
MEVYMDKRSTPESRKANEVIEAIYLIEPPFSITISLQGFKPRPIYDRVRHAFAKTNVAFSLKGNMLIAGNRHVRTETRLKNIIRKLMIAVDDEKLYEEAMEVLHGTT